MIFISWISSKDAGAVLRADLYYFSTTAVQEILPQILIMAIREFIWFKEIEGVRFFFIYVGLTLHICELSPSLLERDLRQYYKCRPL